MLLITIILNCLAFCLLSFLSFFGINWATSAKEYQKEKVKQLSWALFHIMKRVLGSEALARVIFISILIMAMTQNSG